MGEAGDATFLLMEYVPGETLGQRLARGPLAISEACAYAVQMADALRVAHAAGVLHRDVKPTNIMLFDGGIKLLDFGIAKVHATPTTTTITGSEEPTHPGQVLGTLAYMAPEQLTRQHIDHRADIYGFGAVVYEMLSGRSPFQGIPRDALLHAILVDEPTSLRSLRADVPRSLEQIVARCLLKQPDARWHSFEHMLPALRRVHSHCSRDGARRRGG